MKAALSPTGQPSGSLTSQRSRSVALLYPSSAPLHPYAPLTRLFNRDPKFHLPFQRYGFTILLMAVMMAVTGCVTYDSRYAGLRASAASNHPPNAVCGMWSRRVESSMLQRHTRALLLRNDGSGEWFYSAHIYMEGDKDISGPLTWTYEGSGVWKVGNIHQCTNLKATLSPDKRQLLVQCRFFDGSPKHWVFDKVDT